MSMASYNLLKAAADGLADAIRYRTNLKRKRREEEYNYQRDLQRAREEHVYDRALALKENEEDYKIKTDRAIKEEQDKIARKLGYIEKAPKAQDIDFYSPVSVYGANDVRGAYGLTPWAVQRKPETLEDKLAKIDREYEHKENLARIRAAGRGGGRQPSLTPYEKLQHDLSMARTPEEREMILQLHRVAPKAVKGGSGDSDDFDPYKYAKDYQEKIYKATGDYLNFVGPDKAKHAENLWNIERNEKASAEEKKKATEELNKIFEEEVAAGKREMAQILAMRKMWSNTAHDSLMFKTNGKFGFDPNTNEVILMENALKQGDQAIAEIRAMKNAALQGASNPSIMGGQNIYPQQASETISLYSEAPQTVPAVASASEQIPPSVKPFGDVPASDIQQIPNIQVDPNIIDLAQRYKNNVETQRRSGRLGPKMYKQLLSWVDGMLTAYAKGEITGDVIVRSLQPSVYKKNQILGAKSYDY